MADEPVPGRGKGEDPARGQVPTGAGAFAPGGPMETAMPGVALVRALDRACGPERRCGGASDDEAFGLLSRWEATEAWCASAKLGVIRALIRARPFPGHPSADVTDPDALPRAWDLGLTEEVANELAISARNADALLYLAWALGSRLPLTAGALEAGTISLAKARIIAEATSVLSDEDAAAAEALIAWRLEGKTPTQIAHMIAHAGVKVDPEGAQKRRERQEQEEARVRFWREHAGTAALAAFGLPTDEALLANQHIQDRALEYKATGVPGTMDQLRVRAFLDAINGTDARTSVARQGHGRAGEDGTDGGGPGHDGSGPGGSGPGGSGSGAEGGAGLAANVMLTIPLKTLEGEVEHPGDAPGLGVLDPALARQLAAAAARNSRSNWCVTVTDDQGQAIGHGCARPARKAGRRGRGGTPGSRGSASGQASRDGPGFTFIQGDDHGPPGGYGTWRLVINSQEYIVKLVPIPVTSCDHRYESAGYRPSDLLRHLVQVRDGECTQPTCVRVARSCDFEHAVPWHKGGRTCACNGGCRCRRDHKIKQSAGWNVTQPMPGYHRWTTPSGRIYIAGPMRYPI